MLLRAPGGKGSWPGRGVCMWVRVACVRVCVLHHLHRYSPFCLYGPSSSSVCVFCLYGPSSSSCVAVLETLCSRCIAAGRCWAFCRCIAAGSLSLYSGGSVLGFGASLSLYSVRVVCASECHWLGLWVILDGSRAFPAGCSGLCVEGSFVAGLMPRPTPRGFGWLIKPR